MKTKKNKKKWFQLQPFSFDTKPKHTCQRTTAGFRENFFYYSTDILLLHEKKKNMIRD